MNRTIIFIITQSDLASMMLKITSESHSPRVLETTPTQYKKKKRPYKEYQCGTDQIPSEG